MKTTQPPKLGRPRFTTEELLNKQLSMARELEALQLIESKKRSGTQMRRMCVLKSYIRRMAIRIEEGHW